MHGQNHIANPKRLISTLSHGLPRWGGIVYNTTVMAPLIVIDTNILVAALRSNRGASYRLLMLLDAGLYTPVVSVPLVLEYEYAAMKLASRRGLSTDEIGAVIDFICAVAVHAKIHFLWRPQLSDSKDDMLLEAAVASDCAYIVTFNTRDFAGAKQFGIRVIRPQAFLAEIGA